MNTDSFKINVNGTQYQAKPTGDVDLVLYDISLNGKPILTLGRNEAGEWEQCDVNASDDQANFVQEIGRALEKASAA